jgi:hypothetical protein
MIPRELNAAIVGFRMASLFQSRYNEAEPGSCEKVSYLDAIQSPMRADVTGIALDWLLWPINIRLHSVGK